MNEIKQYRDAAVLTAAHLCRHGIKVFPAAYNSKSPLFEGQDWNEYATNNINQFVAKVPAGRFNLAIKFGPDSNLVDVEPDSEEGVRIIDQLFAEAGVRTIAYQSRRGIHRLFQYPVQLEALKNNNPKAFGIECRLGSGGKGFYSICPPSLHPDTGEHYAWLPGCAPWEIAPAVMPDNIVNFFLTEAKASGKTIDVQSDDDGFLPGEGNRHSYLLHFSKNLYCNWLLPLEDCMDLTRIVSQRIGSYGLEGRGELELKNLFKDLKRRHDPAKEYAAVVDMDAVNSIVDDLKEIQQSENLPSEIPDDIFHPIIQQASEHARDAQYPRNLFLTTILTTTLYCLGTAVRTRVSPHHEPTGGQMYAFGVGGSGTGKSRTLKALLGPVSHSKAVTTEASPEGLVSLMSRYPRGCMLEFTEGKEFFKMLGKYGQNAGGPSDNSLFHKCWSGDRIWRTLQKGTFGLDNPHLVVSAAIQQINLNQMPPNDCIDGLLQRMIVYPIGAVPRKSSDTSQAKVNEFLKLWYEAVARLESVKPTVGSDSLTALVSSTGNIPRPTLLTLSDEARPVWSNYAALKRSEQVMAQYPDEHPFRADLVRHAEIALRIAQGLLMSDLAVQPELWEKYQVARQDEGWIHPDIVDRAIRLMDWFWGHKQRMVDHIVESAFNAASGAGLVRGKSVAQQVDETLVSRRRRVERACGEEWTLRDYYTALNLKKKDAEQEIAMFDREGKIVRLALKDGQKVERYKFLGDGE
jgi:hypothetical protein